MPIKIKRNEPNNNTMTIPAIIDKINRTSYTLTFIKVLILLLSIYRSEKVYKRTYKNNHRTIVHIPLIITTIYIKCKLYVL